MKYSFIVPVYNRPDEVDELLESLEGQTLKDFEVVVVEDGSDKPCKDVCDRHADVLDIHYYIKPNSGPGQSRNYGAERAGGEYLIVLDSDVVLPEGYLAAVDKELQDAPADAFGGPDRAHPSFTDTQKAISYSMTSFYTTGGIRGGNKKLDKFYPRSFNMGIRRETYMSLGGFSRMRFGEDIDFSIRIFKAGCRCRLFPEAWVWHKRRTDFRKFWRQVYNSGIARINLKEISRKPEDCPSAAHGIHRWCGISALACRYRLPVGAAPTCLIRCCHIPRFLHREQESCGGSTERGVGLRAASWLRMRLHQCLVAQVRVGEGRVLRFRENIL